MYQTNYTPKEAAKLLKVTRRTVYSWIEQDRLQAIRVGRLLHISHEALEGFLQPEYTETRQEDEITEQTENRTYTSITGKTNITEEEEIQEYSDWLRSM